MSEEREQSNLLTKERVRAFRLCGRLHDYMFLQGYRPTYEDRRTDSTWGAIVGAGLRAVQDLGHGDARSYELFQRAGEHVIGRFLERFSAAKATAYLRCMRSVLEQLAFFRTHEVVAVDKAYMFPHVNPDTGKASPLWMRAGRIGAILRHTPTGRIRVMEHRITDASIEVGDVFWNYLFLDGQISQSVLGAEVMFPGMVVDEVIYSATRKTQFRPLRATPAISRRAKKDGTPCAGTRDRDETPHEYFQRIWEKDFLNDQAKHFRMQVIPRTESQIVDHLRNSWALSQLMRMDRNNGLSVQNPDACHAQDGTCSFFQVCTGQARIDDSDRYTRVNDVHPELGENFLDDVKEKVSVPPRR